MKINFIILLIFFRIKLYISYHLIDGVDKNLILTKNNNSGSLYFYTEVTKPYNVRFHLKSQKVCIMDRRFYIYEYDENTTIHSEFYYDRFNQEFINNTCVFFHLYNNITSSKTKEVQFVCNYYFNTNSYKNISITARIDLVFEEYNLYNGKPLDIFNLVLNNSYYLYLEFFETINIRLIIDNMIQKPFSDINIHELKKIRNSSSIQIINENISFIENNNQLISSFFYENAFSIYTKYLALQIKPSQNISHITVEYECTITNIDLTDGNLTTIYNLTSNEIYLFFIEAAEDTKINISLFINNTAINNTNYELDKYEQSPDGSLLEPYAKDNIPLDYIDINVYEYEKKNNSFISYNHKNFKRLKRINDNYFITEKIFQVNNSNTNYFAFSFKSNYNINFMQVNIELSGGVFQLFNNTSKNIIKLKSNEHYLFYTAAKRFSYICITLTMNYNSNMTTDPFKNFFFQEFYYQDDYKKDYNQGERHYKPVSSIRNGDQLIISVSYNISAEGYKYLFFNITPKYNIDYMIANINVTDCFIDLDNYKNFQGKYYFFKNHIKYYIRMNAWQKYITKLNLKTYNVIKAPFSSIRIYESFYEHYYKYIKNKTQKIKFKKKNDSYEAAFEKKNTFDRHIFLTIEFMPEYDIQYIIAETTISDYFKISTLALILIIIVIIILILMILSIILHFKKCKCKLLKSKDLSPNELVPNIQNQKKLIS